MPTASQGVHRAAGLALLAGTLVTAPVRCARLLFVGGSGCDDGGCLRNTPEDRSTLRTFALLPDGGLAPAWPLHVGGAAAWLTASEPRRCLFVALADRHELAAFKVAPSGAEARGQVGSGGLTPVHLSLSEDGGTLLAANYDGPGKGQGASVASFRIHQDCTLTPLSVVKLQGSSVLRGRQDSAHPHSIVVGRGNLAYSCDLGQDAVFTFSIEEDGRLQQRYRATAHPGDGPRHLVQHPSKPLVYVGNELSNTVAIYRESHGQLTYFSNVSTLPLDVPPSGMKVAEIAVSEDGAQVFVTNRGPKSSVAIFDVLEDGLLKQVQILDVPSVPRGMALVAGADLMVVAGQQAGVVQTFHKEAGATWSWTGNSASGPATSSSLAVMSFL